MTKRFYVLMLLVLSALPAAASAVDPTVVALPLVTGLVLQDQTGASLPMFGMVDFGSTDLGGSKTLAFTLSHPAGAVLTPLHWEIVGTDAGDFVLQAAPVNGLAAGASQGLSVTYVPAVEKKVSQALLRLVPGVGAPVPNMTPVFNLNLSATAGMTYMPVKVEEVGGSVITMVTAPLDFGSPMLGQSTSKTFRLTNLGGAPLTSVTAQVQEPYQYIYPWQIYPGATINSAYWYYPYYQPSGFTIAFDPTFQQRLAPGASTTFTVTWIPYETVGKTRQLLISGSNMAAGPVYIPLTGSAVPYVNQPPRLKGLHYRMGYTDAVAVTGGTPGAASAAVSQTLVNVEVPVAAELGTDTGLRWAGVNYGSPASYSWRTATQYALELGVRRTTSATITPTPTCSLRDAQSGVLPATGSTSGDAFSGGSSLANSVVRLPAVDNVGMELWLRPTGQMGTQCVTFIGQAGDAGFGLWLVDGVVQGRAGALVVAAPGPLAAQQWHHLAFLLQNGTATLRVDGAVVATFAETALPALVQGLSVGAAWDGTQGLEGTVDELRLFEIPADFNAATDLLATAQPALQAGAPSVDLGLDWAGAGVGNQGSFQLSNNGPGWLRILSASFSGDAASEFSLTGTGAAYTPPDPPPVPPGPFYGSILFLNPRPAPTVVFDSTGLVLQAGGPVVPPAGLSVPSAVPPGSGMNFYVQHRSGTPGSHGAMLTLTTNDPQHPVYQVMLHADTQAAAPALVLNGPSPWSWGTLLTNASTTVNFNLYNQGGADLTGLALSVDGPDAQDVIITSNLTGLTLSGDGTGAQTLTSGLPGNGVLVAGASSSFQVTVNPQAAGARLATLRITSNDPQNPVILVPMFGHGAIPTPHATFYVDGAPTTASGTVHDMGGVRLSAPALVSTVNVLSDGTANVDDVTVSLMDGPAAGDFTIEGSLPTSLGQGWYQGITVKFQPHVVGPAKVMLRITSNISNASPFDIVFTALVKQDAPEIGLVAPGLLRAGEGVIGGAPVTAALRLKNTGTLPLTGLSSSLAGSQPAEFSVVFPSSIAPGAEGDATVSFAPQAIGPRSAMMMLSAQSLDTPPTLVRLGGTGGWGPQTRGQGQGQGTDPMPLAANLAIPPVQGWTGTALAALPNGNVLMAGFTQDSGGHKTSSVREIRPDGVETGRVTPSFAGEIKAMAVQADGAVLVTGPGIGVKRIAVGGRGLDSQFQVPDGDFSGEAVLALPDGRVLVGGDGALGGRKRLIRLKTDGSLDASFILPEPDGVVHALALQDDGKVMVGGEFTNLGLADVPSPGGGQSIYLSSTSPHTGLCRLTVAGDVDLTFYNNSLHKVMALAVKDGHVAAAGVELQQSLFVISYPAYINYPIANANLIHIDTTGNSLAAPTAVATDTSGAYGGSQIISQPSARLLDGNGAELSSVGLSVTPAAVTLLDGGRMLVTSGEEMSGSNTPFNPSLMLAQPYTAPKEYFGEGVGPAPDQTSNRIMQSFEGPVRAVLAQADGKVLVAGGMTRSRVGTWDVSNYYYSVPLPVIAPRPVLDPVPVNGFAQLTADGFYKPGPAVFLNGLPLSNRLASIPVAAGGLPGATLQTSGFGAGTTVSIDGPDAADFTSTVPDGWDPGQSSHAVRLAFTPSRAGPHHAVLHLRSGTSEFDAALEGAAAFALPENLLVVDVTAGEVLDNAASSDFGRAAANAPVVRQYLVLNGGATDMTTPVNLTLGGGNAADFSASPASVGALAAGHSATFAVTFTPKALGPRVATLALRSPGIDGYPLVVNLSGLGVPTAGSVPVFMAQPQDALVAVGASVTLTADALGSSSAVTWQWYFNGKPVAGAKTATLTIAAASLAKAGSYSVTVADKSGVVRSKAVRVAVVDAQAKTVVVGEGKAATLSVATAGPGLTFQWLANGAFVQNSTSVAGIATAKLTLSKAVLAAAGPYTCRASLGTLALDAGPITLSVVALPQIVSGLASVQWLVSSPVDDGFAASIAVTRYTAVGLPPGVVLDPLTGRVSGSPTRAGLYNLRVNAANEVGAGPVWVQAVRVRPLPAGVLGGFSGTVPRGFVASSLGGTWAFTVAANGTFTGQLRQGIHGAAGTKPSGTVVTQAIAGRLNFALGSDGQAEGRAELAIPGTTGCHMVVYESGTTAELWENVEGTISGCDAWQNAASIPAVLAGSYSGSMLSNFSPNLNSLGKITLTYTRAAASTWVARFAAAQGGAAFSGSGRVNYSNNAAVFSVLPDLYGGRSVLGYVTAQIDGSTNVPYCDSTLFWSDWASTIAISGPTTLPGFYLHLSKAR